MDKRRNTYHVVCYHAGIVLADAEIIERNPWHAANSLLGHISPFQEIGKVTVDGEILFTTDPKTGHRIKGTTNMWIRPGLVTAQLLRKLIPARYRSSWLTSVITPLLHKLALDLRKIGESNARYIELSDATRELEDFEKAELDVLESERIKMEEYLGFPLYKIEFFEHEHSNKNIRKARGNKRRAKVSDVSVPVDSVERETVEALHS